MAGQSAQRREILRYIGIASVAGSFPGFAKWAFACSPGHIHEPVAAPAQAATNASKAYQPLFFSDRDFRLVEHLAEMIIPGRRHSRRQESRRRRIHRLHGRQSRSRQRASTKSARPRTPSQLDTRRRIDSSLASTG